MSNTQVEIQKIVEEEKKLFNPSNSAKKIIKHEIDKVTKRYGNEDWYYDDLNASSYFQKDLDEQIYTIYKLRVSLLEKLNLSSNYRTLEVLKKLEQQDKDDLFIYDTKSKFLELVKKPVKQKQDILTMNTMKLPNDKTCALI